METTTSPKSSVETATFSARNNQQRNKKGEKEEKANNVRLKKILPNHPKDQPRFNLFTWYLWA